MQPSLPLYTILFNTLEKAGAGLLSVGSRSIEIAGIATRIVYSGVRPSSWSSSLRLDVVRQIYFGAIGALPFIIIVALLIGAGLVYQLLYWFSLLGESGMAYRFIVITLMREFIPLFVALFFSGRSGMAILAEMGGLQREGQIRSLERTGVDTFQLFLLPRALGGFVSMLALSLFMLVFSLLSGLTISNLTGATDRTAADFISGILAETTLIDALAFIIKPFLFSLAIISICAGRGLIHTTDEVDVARQLPVAFTECVVAVFIISGLFTLL